MKKEIVKIWGVGLTVVLVASMLLAAVPASASELEWGSETIPGTSNNLLVPSGDNTDLAVYSDGQTIYSANGSTSLYKSTDGGETWSTISTDEDTDLVAVAPDDADIVAYADTTTLKVWCSIDGGTTWGDLTDSAGQIKEGSAAAAAVIFDIAISPEKSDKHYVAVAGGEAATNVANVWYFDLGAAAAIWRETNDLFGFNNALTGSAGTANSTGTIAFSPNFASDQVMTALTLDATNINFQMFSFNQLMWNNAAGFGSSYPVAVETSTVTTFARASIALSPDYLGGDEALRIAFVGIDLAGAESANDGIVRLKDTSIKELLDTEQIFSIDYDGSNLVAGKSDATTVYRCADPLASTPTVSSSTSLKSPSGATGETIVAWRGTDVVAGTTGGESAFAVSTDNGKTFNDISLINTTLTNLEDVAVSADGSVVYLLTDDGTDLSLWRKASSWQRVLSVQGDLNYLVRIAPDDADVVYVAEEGTKTLYYSTDGGTAKWFSRASTANIQDLAVESASVAYIAVDSASTVTETGNGGFTWNTAEDTELSGGNVHMIASVGEDQVVVGSTTGYVAYSTDGNDSWTKISKQVNDSSSNVQVTASGLAAGDFIYAASEAAALSVRRWEIGSSTSWSDIIDGALAASYGAYGIALSDAGVLYVLASDGTDGRFYRTLSPATAGSTSTWSTQDSAAEALNSAPSALRVSSGSTKLWAIDTTAADEDLFSYEDTLASAGPVLAGPPDGMEVLVNPVSGGTYSVSFSWERPSKALQYNLRVSLDSDFEETVYSFDSTADTTDAVVSHVYTSANFMPETTYYWRVRVQSDGPIYSPYSEYRSFVIGELPDVAPVVVQAPPPAPIITPEIVVPTPTITLPAPIVNVPAPQEVVIPPAPAPAPAVPTVAIWLIIVIGALLVIALIVLIMRTRRPI